MKMTKNAFDMPMLLLMRERSPMFLLMPFSFLSMGIGRMRKREESSNVMIDAVYQKTLTCAGFCFRSQHAKRYLCIFLVWLKTSLQYWFCLSPATFADRSFICWNWSNIVRRICISINEFHSRSKGSSLIEFALLVENVSAKMTPGGCA